MANKDQGDIETDGQGITPAQYLRARVCSDTNTRRGKREGGPWNMKEQTWEHCVDHTACTTHHPCLKAVSHSKQGCSEPHSSTAAPYCTKPPDNIREIGTLLEQQSLPEAPSTSSTQRHVVDTSCLQPTKTT